MIIFFSFSGTTQIKQHQEIIGSVLVLNFPKAGSEIRIWKHIDFWERIPGKGDLEWINGPGGQGRSEGTQIKELLLLESELLASEVLLRDHKICLISLTYEVFSLFLKLNPSLRYAVKNLGFFKCLGANLGWNAFWQIWDKHVCSWPMWPSKMADRIYYRWIKVLLIFRGMKNVTPKTFIVM